MRATSSWSTRLTGSCLTSPDWEKPKAEIAGRRNSMLLDMLAAIARKAEGKTEGALRMLSAMPASPVC
jgi:hypothetical protein